MKWVVVTGTRTGLLKTDNHPTDRSGGRGRYPRLGVEEECVDGRGSPFLAGRSDGSSPTRGDQRRPTLRLTASRHPQSRHRRYDGLEFSYGAPFASFHVKHATPAATLRQEFRDHPIIGRTLGHKPALPPQSALPVHIPCRSTRMQQELTSA